MSVKLTDGQFVMMSAAAQRKDRCLSAPTTARDAALGKVSAKLAKLGLAREIDAKAGDPESAIADTWVARMQLGPA